ncbi:hypothetical protein SLEP1_g57289 [Rubroshorea leprosula]|uniref:Uncharacterized protein n=1 Tax=Rubroshorea leprosula TaxID=152421 RepID=A0AAV5MKS1_9ROSI|nr:hypothetical protein SLEP1_g57289 [Rubroshorea leprosula]
MIYQIINLLATSKPDPLPSFSFDFNFNQSVGSYFSKNGRCACFRYLGAASNHRQDRRLNWSLVLTKKSTSSRAILSPSRLCFLMLRKGRSRIEASGIG